MVYVSLHWLLHTAVGWQPRLLSDGGGRADTAERRHPVWKSGKDADWLKMTSSSGVLLLERGWAHRLEASLRAQSEDGGGQRRCADIWRSATLDFCRRAGRAGGSEEHHLQWVLWNKCRRVFFFMRNWATYVWIQHIFTMCWLFFIWNRCARIQESCSRWLLVFR